jgi:hypothetical protein
VLAGLVLWGLAGCGRGAGGDGDPTLIGEGPPAPGEDGSPCSTSRDCFGDVCLTELEAGVPNGYCTSFNCLDTGCNGGRCIEDTAGNSACLDPCLVASDCRAGYSCVDLGPIAVCEFTGDPGNEVGESPNGSCVSGCEPGANVRVECGFTPSREVEPDLFQWGLPYQLTQGVDGFALTVWPEVEERSQINVVSVRNADEQRLELKGVDSALNVSSFAPNSLVSVTFPFAPRYAGFLDGRAGLLQVQSSAPSLCIARSEGFEGSELTVHLYLIGANGLTPDSLGVDADFQAMLAEWRRLMALGGVEVSRVVPQVIDSSTVERFRVLRDIEDLRELLQTTGDPREADGSSSLVLNLLLVDDIMFADAPDTIGLAGLLPGPPGLHGTRASGVVAEATSLREDPAYLALIVAHESNHYLGLRHTSEIFSDTYAFGRVDPLVDTPECPDVLNLVEDCPDYQNLMFPLAPPDRSAEDLELSLDQGWVLRRNPLVR